MIQDDFLYVFAPTTPGYLPGNFEAEYEVPFASKQNLTFNLHQTNNGWQLQVRGQRTYQSGYVDIIDHGRQEIYEIKHIPSEQIGRAELFWYLSFLPGHRVGSLDYPVEPRVIGPWPTPPWNTTHEVRAEVRNGVIVYWGALNQRSRLAVTAAVAVTTVIGVGQWLAGRISRPSPRPSPQPQFCPVPPNIPEHNVPIGAA